ncbi:MAG: enoyl-CoA hydratase-related protein [Moraxellaceae bacterium]|nr:enoyl-CoA hydratase-related protein [Moraxellaceae bacterium]MDZ4387545.1 enoyl-CoA hydratase-related protein [Moraxellaceae bacterium]
MNDFTLNIDNPVAAVRRISWSRPGKHNAFTSEMYEAICEAVLAAGTDSAVGVLWLTGEGGHFSAGNDLAEFANAELKFPDAPVFRLLKAVSTFTKPLVMTPSGSAIGIGTTLCLHADFIYCQRDIRFQMPFVSLGLCPEGGSSLLIPRLVGQARAMSWLLLGTPILADEALATGLVNAVSETAEQLEQETIALVTRLAELPTNAVITAKRLIKSHINVPMQATLHTEGMHFTELLTGSDVQEAIAAFREKRKPRFNQ